MMGIPKVGKQVAKIAKAPEGLPNKPPKAAASQPKLTDKEVAEQAVQDFQHQLDVLHQMKEEWKTKYPDADTELETILQQEDVVRSTVERAKPLVAACKESIGDFKVTIKHSTAKYDDVEVTKIIKAQENAGEIVQEMLNEGVLTVLNLDKNTSIAWIAKNPQYSELFAPAWKDRVLMTPAVTVPKF